MARRNPARLEFDALSIEGGLLPAEWLALVAAVGAPAQTPVDYGVPKGLQLRDEIGRYWRVAQALWGEFAAARSATAHDAVGAARAFTRQLLTDVLGFREVREAGVRVLDERQFPLAFEAAGGRLPVVVAPAGEGLDTSLARHGDGTRRRSAFGALQEYLNAADGALWGLVTNGVTLRLARDNASMTRPAWIEADLARIFAEDRFADFAALWLLLHSSRFGRPDGAVSDCPLEAWRAACQDRGSRARADLSIGVKAALLALGEGFLGHAANAPLRRALADGTLTREAYFNELLRCIYRMIFLLTIEERDILFAPDASQDAKRLYADGYGMRRLRDRAARRSQYDRHGDLWESLQPVFAGLGRAEGEAALGLPGLGGLFAADQCPHLDAATLENRALLAAIFRLAWLREDGGLARVNWRDMGPEELGSVYESLLELVPLVSDDGRRFTFADERDASGNQRRLTGSYYTPDVLVQQLLDTTLEPVVTQRLAAAPGAQAQAILSITVIDPACGSAHFLLAAARRLAGHLARVRTGGTPGASDYRHALREVITHCIYGVDRNPMAVELARMALWLEAYTPDRALGFLDHHLVCGDAVIGLVDLAVLKDGIPDDAYQAIEGDDRDAVRMLARANRSGRRALEARVASGQLGLELGTQSLGDAFAALDALTDDALTGVEAKRRRWEEVRTAAGTSPVGVAADLFVAAFLAPKSLHPGERAVTERAAAERWPTTGTLVAALEGTVGAAHAVAAGARTVCHEARVLHWPLVFANVFARGGFDVVVGNPPYVSAMDLSRSLKRLEKELWGTVYQSARGAYDLYVLFMERALCLVAPGGLVGLVTPNKYLSAPYAQALREYVYESHDLLHLVDASRSLAFEAASVYPLISTLRRGRSPAARPGSVVVERDGRATAFKRALLGALPDKLWGFLLADGIETIQAILQRSVQLGDIARVNASSTAAEADAYGERLVESDGLLAGTFWKTLNTGLIDRYQTDWGRSPLTHQRKQFVRPALPDGPYISENRQAQYNAPKLIVAKMARHLELFPDFAGEFAALNAAFIYEPRDGVSLDALAGICNSRVMSWVYSRYFGALAMSGGYFQFQAPQLRALPIPRIAFTTPTGLRRELVDAAWALCDPARATGPDTGWRAVVGCVLDAATPGPAGGPRQPDVVHDLVSRLVRELVSLRAAQQRGHDAFEEDVRTIMTEDRYGQIAVLWQPGRTRRGSDAAAQEVLGSLAGQKLTPLDGVERLTADQWLWCAGQRLGQLRREDELREALLSHQGNLRSLASSIASAEASIESAVLYLFGLTEEDIAAEDPAAGGAGGGAGGGTAAP